MCAGPLFFLSNILLAFLLPQLFLTLSFLLFFNFSLFLLFLILKLLQKIVLEKLPSAHFRF